MKKKRRARAKKVLESMRYATKCVRGLGGLGGLISDHVHTGRGFIVFGLDTPAEWDGRDVVVTVQLIPPPSHVPVQSRLLR